MGGRGATDGGGGGAVAITPTQDEQVLPRAIEYSEMRGEELRYALLEMEVGQTKEIQEIKDKMADIRKEMDVSIREQQRLSDEIDNYIGNYDLIEDYAPFPDKKLHKEMPLTDKQLTELIYDIRTIYPEAESVSVVGTYARVDEDINKEKQHDIDILIRFPKDINQSDIERRNDEGLWNKWSGTDAKTIVDFLHAYGSEETKTGQHLHRKEEGKPTPEEVIWREGKPSENYRKYMQMREDAKEARIRERTLGQEWLKLKEMRDKKQEEHLEKQRETFKIKTGITIYIDIKETSKLYKKHWETEIKPQKEFFESIVSERKTSVGSIRSSMDITVEGQRGSGGVSFSSEHKIKIGTEGIVATTPIHEITHQFEEQMGTYRKRSEKAKEYLETKLGKNIEDIELKPWTWYVDASGKEKRLRTRGETVYVPKGLFATPQEESEMGYMFRVYEDQSVKKGTKRYIRPFDSGASYRINRGDLLGTEFLSKASEHIYQNPTGFAKAYPEIFDMAVDLFRGKL